MPQYTISWILGFASALTVTFAAQPPAAEAPPITEPTTVATPQLASIPGSDNGASKRTTDESIAQLIERTATATVAVDKVQLALAAANLILAEGIEPACSRAILQLDDSETDASLKGALGQAGNLLATAKATLDRTDAAEGGADEWRPQAAHRLDTLQAFHAGLSAYLLPAKDTRTARRAASRLSPLLEDADRSVAAAATFWQACLRSLDPDSSRAMSVLDLALSDVRPGDLPYAFFARLLRCRLVAREGGHAAAIALLIQMEDRCDDWFAEETDRGDAVRTIHLTRSHVLKAWGKRLENTDDQPARQWIDDHLQRIANESFREGENTVLRLRPVIPVIAAIPTPAPEPNNEP